MASYCDFPTLTLNWRPNQYLMLPPGFEAASDAHDDSPVFDASPGAVFAMLEKIIGAEPRIEWLENDPAGHRMELVQRSKTFRFPDRISLAVMPVGTGDRSALAAYSRAKIGIRDFGVNRARIARWVAALKDRE